MYNNFDNIPPEIGERPQWVLWKYETRQGNRTKVPYRPTTGIPVRAAVTLPKSWGTMEGALAALEFHAADGVGFVLTPSDPYTVVDMDGCIDDSGVLSNGAAAVVAAFNSYTEITPSGKGLRIILRGEKPGPRCKASNTDGCTAIEVYETLRFITVTGNVSESRGVIHDRQTELCTFYNRLFAKATKRDAPTPTHGGGDAADVLAKMFTGKNGAALASLYNGDTSGHGGDESAADLAMCNALAFYTGGDSALIDDLFRASGLFRDKWDASRPGGTYGTRTIQKAIEGCREFYQPKGDGGNESLRGEKSSPLGETRSREPGSPLPTLGVEEDAFSASTEDLSGTAAKKRAEAEAKKTRRDERTVRVTLADNLPKIETNGEHLRDTTAAALAALRRANDPPQIFARGGSLVRIALDEEHRPSLETLGTGSLKGRLARVANFVSTSYDRGTVPVAPPAVVVEDILTLPAWQGIPPLQGIVTAPVVCANGNLEMTPGYLPSASLYYHDNGMGELPTSDPTPANIAAAKALLLDALLGDFPFVDDAGRAHALALALLPFVRPCIKGATPLHLVDAPVPGSGKSLLVELVTGIFTPHVSMIPADVRDDDEWRKRITTGLLSGSSHLLFDNINRRVDSGSLAAALTLSEWKDRLLGGNTELVCPIRCVWAATGNNTQLSDELTRRTVYIRLDPCMERPWDRDDFKTPDIRGFASANRARLIAACLTLVRAWLQAGRPSYTGKPLGSYEAWARVLGGVMETSGVPGFLANRDELFEKADPERDKWTGFLIAWHEKFKDAKCAVADLYELAVEADIVDGDKTKERAAKVSLGKALRTKIDRVFGTFRFVDAGTAQRLAQYKCVSGVSGVSPGARAYESFFSKKHTPDPANEKKDSYARAPGDTPDTPDTHPDTPPTPTSSHHSSSHEQEKEEEEKREEEKEEYKDIKVPRSNTGNYFTAPNGVVMFDPFASLEIEEQSGIGNSRETSFPRVPENSFSEGSSRVGKLVSPSVGNRRDSPREEGTL